MVNNKKNNSKINKIKFNTWIICPSCSGYKKETFELNGIKILQNCGFCDGRGEVNLIKRYNG